MKRFCKIIPYFTPSIWQSLFIVAIFTILGTIISAAAMYVLQSMPLNSELYKATFLISYLFAFIPVILYIYYKSLSAERSHKIAKIPITKQEYGEINYIVLFIVLAIMTLSLSFILDPINYLIKVPESIKRALESTLSNNYGIISVVIAAPILEEFMMRGVIERGLIVNSTPTKAIIISAALFGIIHLNPWQAIFAFLIGIFMGWIYFRTHSLPCTIFIHFINNGTATLSFFVFYKSIDVELIDLMPLKMYITLYIISLILFVSLMIFLNKKLPHNTFINTKTTENE